MDEPVAVTLEDLLSTHGHGPAEVRILRRVTDWAGSPGAAQDWLCSHIPSLAAAPIDLLREGRADLVQDYLDRIGVGGFA